MKWLVSHRSGVLVCLALLPMTGVGAASFAQEDELTVEEEEAAKAAALADLYYERGRIEIENLAVLDLPDDYVYLSSEGARYVVEDLWGNPPDPTTLGLIHPAAITPLDDDSWAVIVSFEAEGYVEDDDAEDIDYDDLLESMQEESEASNEQRRELGYPTIELIGWAEKPHYDKDTKKLYWAKNLAFEGSAENTLNYNVRILGRKGYLNYNAVSSIQALPEVAAGCKELLARTEFKDGQRYSDFDSNIDKVAAYGIGGLIAGKALLKVGFFAKFAALFAKFAKLIVVAVIGVVVMIRKFFSGKSSTPSSEGGEEES